MEASRQSVSRRGECSLASDTVAHQGKGGPNGPLGLKSGRSTVALRRKALVGRENRWAESLTQWIGKERERNWRQNFDRPFKRSHGERAGSLEGAAGSK